MSPRLELVLFICAVGFALTIWGTIMYNLFALATGVFVLLTSATL